MIAATLTYIDTDLTEKQRKVQVVVFYGPQCSGENYCGLEKTKSVCLQIYTVFIKTITYVNTLCSEKKHPLMSSIIIPAFLGRFLYFLYRWKQE